MLTYFMIWIHDLKDYGHSQNTCSYYLWHSFLI